MTAPRLKAEILVSAHLRRAAAGGASAVIARKGEASAGMIIVKIYAGPGRTAVYCQSMDEEGARIWRDPLSGAVYNVASENPSDPEPIVDQWIASEAKIDPDIWVIEIDDPKGRAFLDTE